MEENHGGRAEISPESDGPAVCISRESFLERRGREGRQDCLRVRVRVEVGLIAKELVACMISEL